MKSRDPYRRHSTQFKLQVCQDIRDGIIGRRDAQRTYSVSANFTQLWLTQFDRGKLNEEEVEASIIAEFEARIAALERKVGQLTMELVHLPGPCRRNFTDREIGRTGGRGRGLWSLADDILNWLEVQVKTTNMSANESQNERHKQSSNPDPLIDLEPSLQKGRAARAEPNLPPTAPLQKPYPLGMVLDACPDIVDYAKGVITNWRDSLQRPRSCDRCSGSVQAPGRRRRRLWVTRKPRLSSHACCNEVPRSNPLVAICAI